MADGEIEIEVSPDLSGFNRELLSGLRRSISQAERSAEIRIGIDQGALTRDLRQAVTQASRSARATIQVGIDATALRSEVRRAVTTATSGSRGSINLQVDETALVNDVRRTVRQASAVAGGTANINLDVDDISLINATRRATVAAAAAARTVAQIQFGVDVTHLTSEAIRSARLAALAASGLADINFGVDASRLSVETVVAAQAAAIAASGTNIRFGSTVAPPVAAATAAGAGAGRATGGGTGRQASAFGAASAGAAASTLLQGGAVVGVGAAAPLIGGIVAASKFETAINRVRAVFGDRLDQGQLELLSNQARELGSTTEFTAVQVADSQRFLALSGFDANEVFAATPGTLQLAAAGYLDAAAAADIASNVLKGFRLEVGQLGTVNDVLLNTSQETNTNVQGLGQAMKFVAPQAASLGLTVQETAAALGLLGDAGLQNGLSGRGLRAAITSLLKPSDKARALADDLGLSFFDAQGQFVGLLDTIQQLEAADVSPVDVAQLFTTQGANVINSLLGGGSEALNEQIQSNFESTGTAASAAAILMEGSRGAFLRFTSALEGLGIAIGEAGVLDFFVSVVERITDWIRALSSLDPSTLNLIARILGVVSAGGILIAILGVIVGAFSLFATVISTIGAPLLAFVAFIGLAIAAIVQLWQNSNAFRAGLMILGDALQNVIVPILGIFGFNLNEASSAANDLAGTIGDKLGVIMIRLAAWINENVVPAVESFAERVRADGIDAAQALGRWLRDDLWPALQTIGGVIRDDVIPAMRDFGVWVRDNLWPALQDLGQVILNEVVPAIKDLAIWIRDEGVPAARDFWNRLQPLIPTAKQVGEKIVEIVVAAKDLVLWLQNAAREVDEFIALTSTIRSVTNFGIELEKMADDSGLVADAFRIMNSQIKSFNQSIGAGLLTVSRLVDKLLALAGVRIDLSKLVTGSLNVFGIGTNETPERTVQGAVGRSLLGADAGTGVLFKEGGIVGAQPGGLRATIGEAGFDEAVIPDPNAGVHQYNRAMALSDRFGLTDAILAANASRYSPVAEAQQIIQQGATTTNNITVQAPANTDPELFGSSLADKMTLAKLKAGRR